MRQGNWLMQFKDGYEAARQIRKLADPRLASIPIAANAFSTDQEKAISSGMNGYLTKPVNIKKLAGSSQWEIKRDRTSLIFL